MRRFVMKLGALVCLFAGLITLWLPLPTGLILIAVGLGLLLMTSPNVVKGLTWLRRRYPGLDQRLISVEPRLPDALRRALEKTRV